MSTRKTDKEQGDGESVRVAEYVLGVLDTNEHQDMARLISENPHLQAEERFWQERLSSLDVSFEEVTPPPATLARIEKRLFGTTAYTGPFAAIWDNIALWRGLAAGGLAALALTVGFSVLAPSNIDQPQTAQLVAALEAVESEVKYLALYDADAGAVRLTALSGEPVSGKDYELWLIEGKNAPISLGVVPVDGSVLVTLADELKPKMEAGVVLAVTLEPEGGAPDGNPTGPLVSAGPVSLV